jgi:heme exporter protein D
MQWNSVSEFFAMGGYALYVWTSFGLTAATVVLEVWQVRQHRAQVLRSLRDHFESERSDT